MHATIRLTPAQIDQLTRIGGGSLSEGIRRLLDRYQLLIGLWARNVRLANNALATARHFGADTAPFEAEVQEAESRLRQFETERQVVAGAIVG